MITADDYELAEAAMLASDSEAGAMRILRDECGWTLRRALMMLRLVRDEKYSRGLNHDGVART